MVPTEEEKQKIQEAQLANPDVPLGSAEQFLLSLSAISDLTARLQLWAFKLDYESLEQVQSHVPHLPCPLPPLPPQQRRALSQECSWWEPATSTCRRCQPGWGRAAGPQGRHGLGSTTRWLSSWAGANAEAPKAGQVVSPVPLLTQEIAEPLFDLKVGMEQLARNHTFKCILATLLAMGNFLNGSQVRSSVWADMAWLERCKDRTSRGAWVPRRDRGKPGMVPEAGWCWWGPRVGLQTGGGTARPC